MMMPGREPRIPGRSISDTTRPPTGPIKAFRLFSCFFSTNCCVALFSSINGGRPRLSSASFKQPEKTRHSLFALASRSETRRSSGNRRPSHCTRRRSPSSSASRMTTEKRFSVNTARLQHRCDAALGETPTMEHKARRAVQWLAHRVRWKRCGRVRAVVV